jgi:Ca2+-binding RTX toxin-like protein
VGTTVLNGGNGNDILIGNGSSVLIGGEGDDELRGGIVSYQFAAGGVKVDLSSRSTQNTIAAGFDFLVDVAGVIGSDFDDMLLSNAASLSIDGGAGTDTLSYFASAEGVSVVLDDFGNGFATGISGVVPGDTLLGIENLVGSTFADTFSAGVGSNTFDGGEGRDTVTYAGAQEGVVVDLSLQTAQDTLGGGLDTLVRIEDLLGSSHADTLRGDATANRLDGGSGDDVLRGGGGSDELIGGAGFDRFVLTDTSGADTFIDFELTLDRLEFEAAAFPLLGGAGVLNAEHFLLLGVTPSGSEQFLVYDSQFGELFYDPSGTGQAGTGDSVLLGSFTPGLLLTAFDIYVA